MTYKESIKKFEQMINKEVEASENISNVLARQRYKETKEKRLKEIFEDY